MGWRFACTVQSDLLDIGKSSESSRRWYVRFFVVSIPGLYHPDLTGVFCTSGSEREFTLEGSWYADEEIQAGTDRDTAAAG
jgi:hypothetical protein